MSDDLERKVRTAGVAGWWTVLVVAAVLPLPCCQVAHSPGAVPALDVVSVGRFVRERLDQVPAIAVSVVRDQTILWEEGFGLADRESGIPASPHTAFYLASVTKAITGTAVMVLRDQRKLSLDRPVNDYLGEAKVHSPMWDTAGATVGRVASHTAGLTTYSRKCRLDDTKCRASTDTAIRRYGILFWPPGEHFDYSNLGYGILGEVVARVSGRDYGDFLRGEIFGPLGMRECSLGIKGRRPGEIAAQYDSSSHARTPTQLSDTPGASSACCSAHDLALFGMFALGEHPPAQRRILSDESLDEMVNPTVDTGDGERYGFGWSLQPDHHGYAGLYAQGGTNDAFAILQMIPSEGIAVAVVANTGTTVPFEIVDRILSDLLPRYRERLAADKRAAATRYAGSPGANPLAGRWTGALWTWEGKLPLALEIRERQSVRVRWAAGPWTAASDVEIGSRRLYCVVRGRIGTPDASQAPCDVELELYLRGRSLVGAGTTRDGAQLPYWVELEESSTVPAG